MHSVLYPRRSIVGPGLTILSADIVDQSSEATGLDIDKHLHNATFEVTGHPGLRPFFAESYRVDNPLLAAPRDPGVATWPTPQALPQGGRFLFLAALGDNVGPDISRQLWLELQLKVQHVGKEGPHLIGGIAFAGHPSLPYYVPSNGLTSANFGLPREWRVSWGDGDDGAEGFIDRQEALTRQIPSAHSGVHFLEIPPVRTDTLRLRIGDFPRILLKSRDPNVAAVAERWGILVPYIGVFAYRESVRRGADLAAGLVAATQSPPSFARSYLPEFSAPATDPDTLREFAGIAADFVSLTPRSHMPMSAVAALGQARHYDTSPGTGGGGTDEVFIANLSDKGDEVRLVVAQAECFGRTVAGIRLAGIGGTTPPALQGPLCSFGVEVYEMETLSGASPVRERVRDPGRNDYAIKLGSIQVTDPVAGEVLVCPFERPSTAPWFCIVLTAHGKGHIGLSKLELVRSAHVAAVPRPARTTVLRQVNLRLVGAGLADDYATIGARSLRLSIERHSGGERRETLFEARTLLDLIDRAGGRLMKNARIDEVVREVGRTIRRSDGWRRTETGDGVGWTRPNPEHEHASELWPGHGTADDPGFTNIANQDVRTHLTHLGPEALPTTHRLRTDLSNIDNIIGTIADPTADPFISVAAASGLTDGFLEVWRGVNTVELGPIEGVRNLNLPPLAQPLMALAQLITYLSGNDPSAPSPPPVEMLDETWRLLLGGALSGGSVSVGAGGSFYVGVNGSLSLGQAVPMANRTVSQGTSGTRQLQASRTGYQMGQSVAANFDDDRSVRHISQRDKQRTRGSDVHWQGRQADLLTARIPLDLEFPALGGDFYEASDQQLLIRIDNDIDPELELDIWMDVIEREVRDDH